MFWLKLDFKDKINLGRMLKHIENTNESNNVFGMYLYM
jgi:hypothetical protein